MKSVFVVLLALLAAPLFLTGCDTTEVPVRYVQFEVTGNASRAFIVQRIEDQIRPDFQNLPWSTDFPANQGLELSLSATSSPEGQSVRVAIYIDEVEVASATSEDGSEIGIEVTVP